MACQRQTLSWEIFSSARDPWLWLMAGVLMCALELLVPASIFLWLGVSALLTGLAVFLLPAFAWQLQLGLFAVLAVAVTVAGRHLLSRSESETDQPGLNSRARQFEGRTATLSEPIVNGVGRIELDNTRWRVLGRDAPQGATVRIVGMEGSSLLVSPVSSDSAR